MGELWATAAANSDKQKIEWTSEVKFVIREVLYAVYGRNTVCGESFIKHLY